LKPAGSTASFDDRVAMTRLAIAGEPGFALSLIDAPRPGAAANYTLDTLLRLRAELPPEGQLFCLIGADSFLSLSRWRGAAEIPFAGSLVIASRPGQPLDDLVAALPAGLTMERVSGSLRDGAESAGNAIDTRRYCVRNPAGETAPLYLLPGLHVEISASQIRAQLREQRSGDEPPALPEQRLLPAPVLDYIRNRELYL
jgi:nicotinate-nucleotide adenylyltransferase